MFCTKCGHQLNEGAAFCGGCGTKTITNNSSEIQPETEALPANKAPLGEWSQPGTEAKPDDNTQPGTKELRNVGEADNVSAVKPSKIGAIMKKNKVTAIIFAAAAIVIAVAVIIGVNFLGNGRDQINGRPPRPLTADELLELGRQFLLDLEYEQAIVHILASILIEPRNEQAYIMLADAYEMAGQPENRQAALEMGFAVFHDSEAIIDPLLEHMVDNEDSQAVKRLMLDMQRISELRFDIFERHIHAQIEADNFAFIEDLFSILREYNEETPLVQILENIFIAQGDIDADNIDFIKSLYYTLYGHDGEALLVQILELTLAAFGEHDGEGERLDAISLLIAEGNIPLLSEGDELFVGEFDDEGRRHGFGIIFFGAGARYNSVIYAGYWHEDLRSGYGIAYDAAGSFIRGEWQNDLPNGWMIYQHGTGTRRGRFSDGLGYGQIYTYDARGNLIWVDLIALTDVVQTFTPQPELFAFMHHTDGEHWPGCPCVHHFWDVPMFHDMRTIIGGDY